MSGAPRDDGLTADQARGREALRALPAAAADPAYRAGLRRDFVAGVLARRPPGRVRRPPAAAGWRSWARWMAAPAAAAALMLAAAALNRGPGWRVTAASGAGVAVVDGRPVPMAHAADIARRLAGGARVRVPDDAWLEIASGSSIALRLAPGTDATVPRPPSRWFLRATEADVRAGKLHITTGRPFRGARLTVTTPAARVEVFGTTLAVICEPEGTCVCVLEGRVRVGGPDGPAVEVEPGTRRFVFDGGRVPIDAGIRQAERVELEALRRRRP